LATGGLKPLRSFGRISSRRSIPPKIRLRSAVLRTASLAEINYGLRAHRELDRLPFGFTSKSGKKIMLATASDYSITFIAAAERSDNGLRDTSFENLTKSRSPIESGDLLQAGTNRCSRQNVLIGTIGTTSLLALLKSGCEMWRPFLTLCPPAFYTLYLRWRSFLGRLSRFPVRYSGALVAVFREPVRILSARSCEGRLDGSVLENETIFVTKSSRACICN
jgi:hypothetical protein